MEATEAMVLTAIVLVYASECTMEETVAAEVPVVQLTYERTAHQTYPSQLQQQYLLLLEVLVKRVRHTVLVPLVLQATLAQLEVPTQVHGLVGHQTIQLVEEEIHHLQRPHVLEMEPLQQVQFKQISLNQTMYKQVQHRRVCSHFIVQTFLYIHQMMSIISKFK
tara:strand:+ start:126 stop:617 length:492 start_codon:yes stop_codon:yes gene_type:complete